MLSRERIGTEVGLMKGRFQQKLRNKKESVGHFQTRVSAKARRAARTTDYYVHDNAWIMMALSAGAAFAAGFLLSRGNQQGIAERIGREVPNPEEKVRRLSSMEFVHSAIPLALFLWKAVAASRCARNE